MSDDKPTKVTKVWRNVFKLGGQFDWLTLELAEQAVRNFGEKRFSRTLVPITITETEGHDHD